MKIFLFFKFTDLIITSKEVRVHKNEKLNFKHFVITLLS